MQTCGLYSLQLHCSTFLYTCIWILFLPVPLEGFRAFYEVLSDTNILFSFVWSNQSYNIVAALQWQQNKPELMFDACYKGQ